MTNQKNTPGDCAHVHNVVLSSVQLAHPVRPDLKWNNSQYQYLSLKESLIDCENPSERFVSAITPPCETFWMYKVGQNTYRHGIL